MFSGVIMNEYKKWLIDCWTQAGGLITQQTAAKIADLNRSTINMKIKKGELTAYQFKNEPAMLSLTEILHVKRQRAPKKHIK